MEQMQEYEKILFDGCHLLFKEYLQRKRIPVHILNCATCNILEESLDDEVRMLKTGKYSKRLLAWITPSSIIPYTACALEDIICTLPVSKLLLPYTVRNRV